MSKTQLDLTIPVRSSATRMAIAKAKRRVDDITRKDSRSSQEGLADRTVELCSCFPLSSFSVSPRKHSEPRRYMQDRPCPSHTRDLVSNNQTYSPTTGSSSQHLLQCAIRWPTLEGQCIQHLTTLFHVVEKFSL